MALGKRYYSNFTENVQVLGTSQLAGLDNRPISIEIHSELSGEATTGLNGIFATGQILTDGAIEGVQSGDTIAISGSSSNDGDYIFNSYSNTGPPLYPHVYNVSPSPGALEEDTGGFTATITKGTLERTCPFCAFKIFSNSIG